MIFEYIERLRNYSPNVRKRFAMTFSIGATLLIALLWLSVLYINSLGNRQLREVKENEGPSFKEDLSNLFKASNTFYDEQEVLRTETEQPKTDISDDWKTQLEQFNEGFDASLQTNDSENPSASSSSNISSTTATTVPAYF
jgi:hypothetical protein